MYYSFSRLVNATNPKTAFNKINTFEEYIPFLEKPIITFPVCNEENLLKAKQIVTDMLKNELKDYCLPQLLCIDIGPRPKQKKHNYIIFGVYHS